MDFWALRLGVTVDLMLYKHLLLASIELVARLEN